MLQHAQLHLHDSLHSVHTHSYYLHGEAKNSIRSRFSQHKHNIATHNKDTVVSTHFNQTNHNLSMLRISVVQFFTENPKNSRKTDFMHKNMIHCGLTNNLHTNHSQHCHSFQNNKHTTHSQIQQFGISIFKTSGKHFIKRHYIPQQIFHHLLIHQSQKFAKHFSTYKILMLNFYSLYLVSAIVSL